MKKLEKLINDKKAKVAIIGLGYVGLPTAVAIAESGYQVLGIDIQAKKVKKVNQGKSYIRDVSSDRLKKVVKAGQLKAFNNHKPLKKADIVLICVPTPLDKNKVPNISFIEKTAKKIAKYLHKEQLIILESSTYPGTTREVILPILKKNKLKAGEDFYLAYSPERIDPGNNEHKLQDIPRVVGGITEKCTQLATQFYQSFIQGKVKPLSSPKAAEMTKILENTFRLVNISMINELALLCAKLDIDIWEIIEAAKTKPYGFTPFYPSPKVGGHCIPLDPFYLSWKAKENNFWTRFIDLAGEINELMPHNVVTRVIYALNKNEKSVAGSKILILGVTYKKDVADPRGSAAHDIIWDLKRKGAAIDYFDPYVKEFTVKHSQLDKSPTFKSIKYNPESLKKYDLVLILTAHSGVDYNQVAKKAKIVVDTRNAIQSRKHKNVYWW